MAMTKVCPKCHCVQHCRRSLCKTCDYVFRRTTESTSRFSCIKKLSKESEEAHELRKHKYRLRKAETKSETILEADACREYYRHFLDSVQLRGFK